MSPRGSRSRAAFAALLVFIWLAAPATAEDQRPKKDKGEARMSIGAAEWTASRASAYKKEGRLKILASSSKSVNGKRVRESLTLSIPDFDGPGTYEIRGMNSNFTSVGLNVDGLDDKGKSKADADAAAEKLLRDALSGSKVLLLRGARITIQSIDEKQVEGVFSWEDPTGRSSLTNGVFRAIVKKPRKNRERKRE